MQKNDNFLNLQSTDMTFRRFFGICDQTTEYLDEFRSHSSPPESKKIIFRDKTFLENPTTKTPKFSTSYDTLQKLDYANRPTFDGLWPREPKTVGLNYRVPSCIPTSRNEQPRRFFRQKPFALANPAVDVDQVDEDSELRKILLAYTYKTWKKRDDQEVWQNWGKTDGQSAPICDDFVDSVRPEFKRFPDLPAGFKAAAKKWDSLQDRTVLEDEKPQRSPEGPKKSDEAVKDLEKMIESINEEKSRPGEELELLDEELSLADDNDSDDESDEKPPEKAETRLSK